MNDRELLELAAKADGVARSQWDYEWVRGRNPLKDDGDALRLAVTLGIRILHVNQESYMGYPNTVVAGTFEFGMVEEMYEDHNDCFAAVRRAIVRAAALIGEGE